jgi:hypothetical protein
LSQTGPDFDAPDRLAGHNDRRTAHDGWRSQNRPDIDDHLAACADNPLADFFPGPLQILKQIRECKLLVFPQRTVAIEVLSDRNGAEIGLVLRNGSLVEITGQEIAGRNDQRREYRDTQANAADPGAERSHCPETGNTPPLRKAMRPFGE